MTINDPVWRTSSVSDGMQCVAVADLGDDRRGIRHSKDEPDFSREEFAAFIAGAKKDEFDDLC
ncbi:MAG TPA: DUF397 domain-containing protein [Acidimicrobiales bacterium]|nr:DUF397 domain-containing protein [Acidimicrobiales bacterium]